MEYPCDTCTRRTDPENCADKYCGRWKAWFLWRWQRFNDYYAAECKKAAKREGKKCKKKP